MLQNSNTNCQNHVVLNLPTFFRRWVFYKVDKHLTDLVDLDKYTKGKVVDYIMKHLLLSNDVAAVGPFKFPVSGLNRVPEDLHFMMFGAVDYIIDKARFGILVDKSLDEADMKLHWWNYLYVMRRLLIHIEKHIDEVFEAR